MVSHLRVHLNGFGVRFHNYGICFFLKPNKRHLITNRFRHQQSDTELGHFVELQAVPNVCDD